MLTTLQKALQAEKNNPTIFDIILYGSAVKGKSKPRDIDIVVIFRYGTVRERLAIIQNLKQKIRVSLEVDIKGILWEELFKPDFFARTGIFLEGISLLDGKPVAQKLGFQAGVVLFVFNLKNKSHTDKVKFNYILSGRSGALGIVKKLKCHHFGPGVVQVPISSSLEFEDLLKSHTVSYTKQYALVSDIFH